MDFLMLRRHRRREAVRRRRAKISALRIKRRHLRDHSDPFNVTEETFRGTYRLSTELARRLIEDLRDVLPPAQRVTAIPLELKVLCTLHFYAQGCYQKPTGKDVDLSLSQASVSRCIAEVTDALNVHLLRQWIQFPATQLQRATLIQKNFEATGIPGTIGYIDGTHVALAAPAVHEEAYVNRKNYHSMNVQITCDSDLIILNILARYPGSTHDAYIWRFSALRRKMVEINTAGERGWLLGDSGYPLEPWLHVPILDAAPGSPAANYTRMHIQARNRVERCIGVLKKRFRCLLRYRTLEYAPQKVGRIINACAMLHNICVKARLPEPPQLEPHVAAVEAQAIVPEMDGENDAEGENVRNAGVRVRNMVVQRVAQ